MSLLAHIPLCACLILMSLATFLQSADAQTPDVGHMRLVDRLDRPQDGYCLDILGTGRNLRLALPIFAHNCKPFLTTDSAVTLTEAGEIVFVAVDACITVFGVNGRSLPGSPIVLRGCEDAPLYFDSAPLQKFDWTDDRRLQLRGSGLCLAVGDVSTTTHVTSDVWRTLSVEDCETVPDARGTWEFIVLN